MTLASDVKPLSKAYWWTVFLFSTVSLSQCFHHFKLFTLTPNLSTGLAFLGVILLFVSSMIILAYDSYVKEKIKGSLHQSIRFFEWIYAQQQMTMAKKGGSVLP